MIKIGYRPTHWTDERASRLLSMFDSSLTYQWKETQDIEGYYVTLSVKKIKK